MGLFWVQSSKYEALPQCAVVGGHDSDGCPIYVGRAYHECENLPAKVVPSKCAAFVAWNGAEHVKAHYDVLVGNDYTWVRCCGGCVPHNAVSSGNTRDGEPLYIGRGCYCHSLAVGKVHPSHGCLYIPYDGCEIRLDSYEVLCRLC